MNVHPKKKDAAVLMLDRKWFTDKSTIGELSLDNFLKCHTLEDRVRDPNKDGKLSADEKIYGETAIPAGRYEIVISYSRKFQKKLPLLLDVPYFTGIRIHAGITPAHTLGCILVGVYRENVPDQLNFSRHTFSKLMSCIEDEINYRKLYIQIKGGPGA